MFGPALGQYISNVLRLLDTTILFSSYRQEQTNNIAFVPILFLLFKI